MTELALSGVVAAPFVGLDARFESGVSTLLGTPAEVATLVALVSGNLAPRRGTVTLDGARPRKEPAARRRIAALFADEPPLEGASLEASLAEALALRGASPADAARVLADAGLGAWRARAPRSLDAAERRSVALALALAHGSASLYALCEPLAALPGIDTAWTRARIAKLAGSGGIVLCATASVRDATTLGAVTWVVGAGCLTRRLPQPLVAGLPAGAAVRFRVQATRARELSARLVSRAEVRAATFSGGHAGSELCIDGSDVEALALAISVEALAVGASIDALEAQPLETS